MKKILGLCLFLSSSIYAKTSNLNNFIEKAKDSDLKKCVVTSLELPEMDAMYDIKYNSYLNSFGAMKLKDFDVGECISRNNIVNGVITAHFLQKNKTIVGQHLESYVAYNPSNQQMLIIVLDKDKKSYILGDKDQNLISALESSFVDKFSVTPIDYNSTRIFNDIGNEGPTEKEKIAANIQSFQALQAEIITNASKNIKKSNLKDLIKTDTSFNLMVENDEGGKSKVLIIVKLDPALNVPISKSALEKNFNFVLELIKIKLKNPYSLKPREVVVKQSSTKLEYIVKYTAQNSYGADVVGLDGRSLYLWSDGKYHPEPSK